MYWSDNGNVGVGIATPQSKLHIADGLGGEQLRLSRGTGIVRFSQSFNVDDLYLTNSNATKTYMYWSNNGNIGVGTSMPISKFHIVPALSEANIITEGLVVSRAGYVNQKAIFNYNLGNLNIIAHDDQQGTGYINMQTWNGTSDVSRLFINTNGYVGIGNLNPSCKLDVCGTIRANEIKVDLTGGCDFVFKSDYKLIDLKDLEIFVATNQHLPEIASEKEMIENGVNMKEFQMKLLQKIEEMTLYMIEQNKRIEKLENENDELKKK